MPPHEVALCEDVPLHRLFQHGAGGLVEVGQHGIRRVELEEVAMVADRRARTMSADQRTNAIM